MHVITILPPPHEHTYNEDEWVKDETHHWHAATCEHTEEVKDKAEHTWDAGKVTKPATTTETGVRTFTCTVCGHTKTEEISKSGTLQFAPEFSIGKTYNRTQVSVGSENIVRNGKALTAEEIDSILFKVKDAEDGTYTKTAPVDAGEYTVKITAKATEEHEQNILIEDFTISPKPIKGSIAYNKTPVVYNGSEQSLELELSHAEVEDIIDGDTINFTSIRFSKDAGENKKALSYTCNNSNYTAKTDDFNITATINPIVISKIINVTKPYDDNAVISGFKNWTGTAVIDADKSTLTLEVTMKGKDAGTSEIESCVLKQNGIITGNYKLENPANVTAQISKQPLKLKNSKNEIQYTGSNVIEIERGKIEGIVKNEKISLLVKMSDKDAGTTEVLDCSIKAEEGAKSGNYSINIENVKGKVKIIEKTLKFSPIPTEDKIFATILIPDSPNVNTDKLKKREIYITESNGNEVCVTVTSSVSGAWDRGADMSLSSYSLVPSDTKNYIIESTGIKFGILTSSPKLIELGKSVRPTTSPTAPDSTTFIYTFKPTVGKTYKAQISDPGLYGGSFIVASVMNVNGIHYLNESNNWSNCTFTAKDESDHYIFLRLKKGSACNLVLTEVN